MNDQNRITFTSFLPLNIHRHLIALKFDAFCNFLVMGPRPKFVFLCLFQETRTFSCGWTNIKPTANGANCIRKTFLILISRLFWLKFSLKLDIHVHTLHTSATWRWISRSLANKRILKQKRDQRRVETPFLTWSLRLRFVHETLNFYHPFYCLCWIISLRLIFFLFIQQIIQFVSSITSHRHRRRRKGRTSTYPRVCWSKEGKFLRLVQGEQMQRCQHALLWNIMWNHIKATKHLFTRGAACCA